MNTRALLVMALIPAAYAPARAQKAVIVQPGAGPRSGAFPLASPVVVRELQSFVSRGDLSLVKSFSPDSEDIRRAVGLMLPYLPDDIEGRLVFYNKGVDHDGDSLRSLLAQAKAKAEATAGTLVRFEAEKTLRDVEAGIIADPEMLEKRARALSAFGIYGWQVARPIGQLGKLARQWRSDAALAKGRELARALMGELRQSPYPDVAADGRGLESRGRSAMEAEARALVKALPGMSGDKLYGQVQLLLSIGRHGDERAQLVVVNGLAGRLEGRWGRDNSVLIKGVRDIGQGTPFTSVARRVIEALGHAFWKGAAGEPGRLTFDGYRLEALSLVAQTRPESELKKLALLLLSRQPSDFDTARERGRVSASLSRVESESARQQREVAAPPRLGRLEDTRWAARVKTHEWSRALRERLDRARSAVSRARAIDLIPMSMFLLTVLGLVAAFLALIGVMPGGSLGAIDGMIVAFSSLVGWIVTTIVVDAVR